MGRTVPHLSSPPALTVAWTDRLKNGTIAKLALRVAELYQQAKQAADLAPSGTESTAPFAFPEVRSFTEISRQCADKRPSHVGRQPVSRYQSCTLYCRCAVPAKY